MAYKDIHTVAGIQEATGLVRVLGRFQPKRVRMTGKQGDDE
ncbi:RtcB family protein [Deinococcus peraridilitoris]|nr:RtcB family protein [Deinococcus peraridilitoris]